jgi:hypothetical protein
MPVPAAAAADATWCPLCPPPAFPDLFAAFAGTLRQGSSSSAAAGTLQLVRNLSAELTGCPARDRRRLALHKLRVPGCDDDDEEKEATPTGCDCSRRRSPSCAVTQQPNRLPVAELPSSGHQQHLPPPPQRPPPEVDIAVQQYSRSDKDNWIESANTALDDPDSGLHPAIAYQSTVSTSATRPDRQTGPSAFGQLWASVHGRLLIVAVSVTMFAAVIVFVVWICLRKHLQKYEAPPQTEEAVSMYGRVLADQRKTATAVGHLDGTSTLQFGVSLSTTSSSNERTFITGGTGHGLQPVRRYL